MHMSKTEDYTRISSGTATKYTIEQIASRTGLTRRTLRYYEELGLLPAAERSAGNYRLFCEADIQSLEHIKKLRDLLGFSLADIKIILEAERERDQIRAGYAGYDTSEKLVQLDRSDELIRRQLEIIQQKQVGLAEMQELLEAKLRKHEHKRRKLKENW